MRKKRSDFSHNGRGFTAVRTYRVLRYFTLTSTPSHVRERENFFHRVLRDSRSDIIFLLAMRIARPLIFLDLRLEGSRSTIAVISIYWISSLWFQPPLLRMPHSKRVSLFEVRFSFLPCIYRVSNDAYRMDWKAGWIHYRFLSDSSGETKGWKEGEGKGVATVLPCCRACRATRWYVAIPSSNWLSRIALKRTEVDFYVKPKRKCQPFLETGKGTN